MSALAELLLGQPWAMHPDRLRGLVAAVESIGALPEKSARTAGDPQEDRSYSVNGGVATIPIKGVMLKDPPGWLSYFGIASAGTERIRQQIAEAVEDDDVERILLDIDSPGGTVAGTAALADDVYAARGLKPINARVSDMMASAALWVGTQADSIEVGPTAVVGSIGAVAIVDDFSERFKAAGIKTHVVSSAELKGAFATGAPITKAQIAELQHEIDDYTALFVQGVARGRGMSTKAVRTLATGGVWIGADAVAKGLADSVSATALQSGDTTETEPESTPENQPDENETAPTSAMEDIMDKKQVAELQEKVAALEVTNQGLQDDAAENEARVKIADESLANAREQERRAIMEAHKKRITPAMSEHLAAFADNEKLAAFLATLPVAVREEPLSETPADANADTGAGNELTAEDRRVAATFKVDEKIYAEAVHADAITFDGQAIVNGEMN